MLRRSVALAVAVSAVALAAGMFAKVLQPGDQLKAGPVFTAEPRVGDSYIRDPKRISLPKASVGFFPVGTYEEPAPTRRVGEFSGRFYGAFETSWFQPSNKSEIWFLAGPGSDLLWSLWESDQTIPYGPDHPDFDPNDPRPIEEWFWPYVCVEATVRGTWESLDQPSPYPGALYVEEVIETAVVDLPVEECVPASRMPRRPG